MKSHNLYFKYCLIFIFIILMYKTFSNNLNISDNQVNSKNNITVCICTPGKKENRYIREFVIYYKNYGVDKIFLYDNNDINDEHFEDVIKDFVDKGFVIILNWRGKKNTGYTLRNDCYLNNRLKYDWLIFYDLDEYINLKNYTNIKPFLNQKIFKNCLKINLNWLIHTDNDLIYYDNRTLHERFPDIQKDILEKKNIINRSYRYKFILRGNKKSLNFSYYYLISKNFSGCNGNGKKSVLINDKKMKNPDFENYYIDHYYFKSIEEFIEKINRGDNYFGKGIFLKIVRIKRFFRYNKVTSKKLKYIEKYTGIDLSDFKKNYSKKIIKS